MSDSPPWMPFNVGDYLRDTAHLTVVEHGAYMLLIMRYWQEGGLPSDEKLIARYAHLTAEQWNESKDVLLTLIARGHMDAALNRNPRRRPSRPAIPLEVRRLVKMRDGDRCRYCGQQSGPFDLDHVLPWSRGGRNVTDNLVVACVHCNRSKGALTAFEFLGFDLQVGG